MKKKIVIKYGGVALKDSDFAEINAAIDEGYQPIIIHGGGKEVTEVSVQLGIRPIFKNGLRVTDAPTMDIVQMVLIGRVNTRLIAALQAKGIKAVGLSGAVQACDYEGPESHVGQVSSCDREALESLCEAGFLPILAPIAIGANGKVYNVNGDSFAAAVAVALKADRLFLMTDVDGVYLDKDNAASKFKHLCADVAKNLQVHDGMIPKLKAAVQATESGVGSVLIGKSLEANTVVTL